MLVVIKINEVNCRGVIATNFSHSFCGSALVKSLKPQINDLVNPPKQATSDGTPIEFLGEAMVQLELGPWQSDGLMPLLVAWDCPADILIGEDLINEIGKRYPVKFEFYKNAVNIGGTRVSMLDPMASEEKFMSVVVKDPRTNEEIDLEAWKKGNKEAMEPGGLVKRRVEVIGSSSSGGKGGGGGKEAVEEETRIGEGGVPAGDEHRGDDADGDEEEEEPKMLEECVEVIEERRVDEEEQQHCGGSSCATSGFRNDEVKAEDGQLGGGSAGDDQRQMADNDAEVPANDGPMAASKQQEEQGEEKEADCEEV